MTVLKASVSANPSRAMSARRQQASRHSDAFAQALMPALYVTVARGTWAFPEWKPERSSQ